MIEINACHQFTRHTTTTTTTATTTTTTTKVIVRDLPTSSPFDWTIGWHKTDWAVLSTNNNFKFNIIAPYNYYKIGQIK